MQAECLSAAGALQPQTGQPAGVIGYQMALLRAAQSDDYGDTQTVQAQAMQRCTFSCTTLQLWGTGPEGRACAC